MITCDNVRQLFSAYQEEMLTPVEKNALENHLAVCADCRTALSRMEYVQQRLQQLSSLPASAQFDQRLRARILHDKPIPGFGFSIKSLSLALSGVTALAAITFFTLTNLGNPVPDTSNHLSRAQQQNIQTHQVLQNSNAVPQLAREDTLKKHPETVDQKKIHLVGEDR